MIGDLGDIRIALWEIDIPHPTNPEYVEHHNQIMRMIALVDEKMDKYKGKVVDIHD